MDDPNFLQTVREGAENASTKFTVSLSGFSGADTEDQVLSAIRAAEQTGEGFTNVELRILSQAGRLPDVNFVRNGVSVPNPFASGG
jgi:hypothetical protein